MSFRKFAKTSFLKSAANTSQFPKDTQLEVAFVGRSNAGKSTVINSITGSNIAKVSKTPGRTRLVNFFSVVEHKNFVDLPGFGYAKVTKSIQKQWSILLEEYFATRDPLVGIILIMDIRHPLKPTDIQMLEFCHTYDIPTHILLNKADKLSKNARNSTLQETVEKLGKYYNPITLQIYSTPKNIGIEDLVNILTEWLKL
ncbi:MAG: YihA family ribosome biogenesis GTP-binding protein [Legionellales bacterium]|nr:YihA family ribosome biogenesis GTP-binding protein [Legionellales bacterium]